MKRTCAVPFGLLLFALMSPALSLPGQTFVGTNAPGASASFSFSVNSSATNLSLVLSNSASAYSHLLLAKGRTPTATDYDFISQMNGKTNQINLQFPEFAVTNYGLLVRTPAGSTTQAFTVVMTTNRSDLRLTNSPALKPIAFTTTGFITNAPSAGTFHYFQVDVPTNIPGWRLVLDSSNAAVNLYVRRGALPTLTTADRSSVGQPLDTMIFTDAESTNATYFIGVSLPAGSATNSTYTLSTEIGWLKTLAWDPGTHDPGTQIHTNTSATGGDYYFKITTQSTANQAWRSALRVISGEADLYIRQGQAAQTNNFNFASTRVGSDGMVLAQVGQWAPGQDWYLTVHATPGSDWRLVTGEAYVEQLPPLAADASSGTNGIIGPEGIRFFKTTISPGTLAWRLGLDGLNNTTLVHRTRAPLLYNGLGGGYYDWSGNGQLLLVPNYVNVGSQYLIGVYGNPGQAITLDSRQQPVSDIPFNGSTNVSATTYGYLTFRVQVPVQQIAWQVNLTPAAGNPNLAVRRDNVPNEYTNDAFSEISGSIGDSVTMVPPALSDGTFYVTVYGTPPFSCTMSNGQPVITDVSYIFSITNDAPARAGWRFYRVANVAEQLGTYGWDLLLSNHVAGTEIAIRRNAVPGRWSYRSCQQNCSSQSQRGYVDYSGTSGFLQRPGHQADIWYIGVYQPTNALGAFVLSGQELTATPLSFDGGGSSQAIVDQPAGKWQYFIINVPTNAMGWDVRLNNVTSGDPYLTICRDRLPFDLGTHDYNGSLWIYPWTSTSWPSGFSWAAQYDWTGLYYNANGGVSYGKILAMGMGNPLQAGTYYIGVINNSGTTPMSYTFNSRGIGPGMTIPVANVAFNGGAAGTNALAPREAAYYSVQVPSNTPSWKVRLNMTNSEALLAVQKDYLPNVVVGSGNATLVGGGRLLQKLADEQYLLLPTSANGTNVVAGTYYIAVVSEGQNPGGGVIGSNSSAFTFTSLGSAPTNQLGNLTGVGPDLSFGDTLLGGEVKFYQFTVSTGVLAMEVRLDNRTANPRMMLRPDDRLPTTVAGYGRDLGNVYTWSDQTMIHIATPQAGTYTMAVQAETFGGTYSNASYTVVVHPLTATPIAFDGSATVITAQTNAVWRYFVVDVPANILGWDLRLTNTSGDPRLVVCRDLAPIDLSTRYYGGGGWVYPWTFTTWPSSNQWAAAYDWTAHQYDANGTSRYGHILQMGMGNPLEPGRYYIGVSAANQDAAGTMNYTLLSRGIGTNQSIPVYDLGFVDSVSATGIPPREAVYYRVQVPPGNATWKMRLGPSNSDAMLAVQRSFLPNVAVPASSPVAVGGGRALQKPGVEQYGMLPRTSEATITNGTYYLAVISEGQNPGGGYIGSNTTSFTLSTLGVYPTNQLGVVDASGATDITFNDTLEGGEFKYYQFTVPPGTLSLEVHLENRVANPYMTLRADGDLPRPPDSYGSSDGHTYTWQDPALINLTSPTPTNYTLCVQARSFGGGYSNASYTIRIHALGLIPVAFDGGTNRIIGQPAGTWQYFTINVPSNALGWDLRLTNVTAGDPRFVIRRGELPDGLSTHTDTGGGWVYPWSSTTWPVGYQWAAAYDWTGWQNENNGSNNYARVWQAGMGNPLQAGTYIIGVINGGGGNMTYTIVSRGIGTNLSIPVLDLPFIGSVSSNGLPARDVAYYRVTVPAGQTNWKLRLEGTSGESLLMLNRNYLPNVNASVNSPIDVNGGRLLQKSGNEQYLLLPASGQTTIPGGTYYVAVASEGINPGVSARIGSNGCSFVLSSLGPLPYVNLGAAGPVDLVQSNNLQAGEIGVYQFTVPSSNNTALEVRLDNRIGNSQLKLRISGNAPAGHFNNYGFNNGESATWSQNRIINLPNVSAGFYSLNLHADPATDQSSLLRVRLLAAADLAFDRTLSTPSLTNVVSGTLSDLQRTYFRVTVPATFNGQPVVGWRLTLDHTQGNPRLRVRKNILPVDDGTVGNTPYRTDQAVIVPPFLTAGTWYVEVQGQGTSQFTLTSSALVPERPAWNMPAIGGSVTTPGLPAGGPVFGDTGVDTNGVPLPGDQGVDLEQGRFHYYAVVVPSNNVGILRTRLDAISGDPDLYLRSGNAPTLTHSLNGDGGAALYERSLTAGVGSEYGNWVPIDGRDEHQLSPGTWYIAVEASGNSNVRYRLLVSLGVISELAYDGVALIGQTLAAGDWRYYRVFVPTNAFTNWNVTFAQALGDVVMYVRDITPPGQGTDVTDYRHWQPDNKNHGPYASYDPPNTYTLQTPPIRPGSYYYLGFRAVNDATFSVSCTTNANVIDYTNTIPFYGGSVTNVIPANGVLRYRIDVPGDGRRWIHTSTHSNTVRLYLAQGTIPKLPSDYHWSSSGSPNSSLNQALYGAPWPWRPGYMYFLFVTNTSTLPQNFVFNMNGKNAATDDNDGDGLPDAWELACFASTGSYNGTHDPDGDGVNNNEEYLEGTVPCDVTSFRPRLLVNALGGSVTRNPPGNPTLTPPKISYALNETVQLSATPSPGYSFLAWSGDAAGATNTCDLVMTTNKTVTAIFGITNNSGADYQFQMTLASSVGSPPDLQNIGAGNIYVTETVDTCSRTVLQFPLHNGVRLQPTVSVIPSNIYTIVMLFRLEQTNGYRRLIDFKAAASDNGVYVRDGRLRFHGVGEAAAPTIPANVYLQVVITRDGTNVAGYVNGVQQFDLPDPGSHGIISAANDLRFFKDNAAIEESAGAVARIRLYAQAMPPGQVALLDRFDCGTAPHFLRPYFETNTLQLPVELLTPGIPYRLEASSNLFDWLTLSTNISATTTNIFVDPEATNHLRRYYRLVTP